MCFKLKGFDKNGIAAISDWGGGELASLAGGCNSGVSLRADPKVSTKIIGALSPNKEYASSNPQMRAAKPTLSEILFGRATRAKPDLKRPSAPPATAEQFEKLSAQLHEGLRRMGAA